MRFDAANNHRTYSHQRPGHGRNLHWELAQEIASNQSDASSSWTRNPEALTDWQNTTWQGHQKSDPRLPDFWRMEFYHDPPCQRNTPTYATSRWLNPTLTLFTSTLLENSSAASTLPVGVVGNRLLTSVHFASITVARVFGDPFTPSAPDPDRTASKNDSPPLRYQTWSPRPPKERNHRYSSSCQDVGGVGQQNWHKKWHETKRLTWLTSKIANEYPAPHRENAPMLMLQARISCPTATWRVCTTCNSAEYWRPLMRCSEGIWRWNWALAIGSDNLMMWIQHQCGDQ